MGLCDTTYTLHSFSYFLYFLLLAFYENVKNVFTNQLGEMCNSEKSRQNHNDAFLSYYSTFSVGF